RWVFGYNWANSEFVWFQNVGVPSYIMKFTSPGSNDYTGGVGSGISFPNGIVLAGDGNTNSSTQSRLFGASNVLPAGLFHLQGDCEVNTLAGQGGSALWCDAYG